MATQCPKCKHENPDDTIYCGKCATTLLPSKDIGVTRTIETPVEEFTRGTIFADRYEIIEQLGKGGMGTVYRVEDKKIGQDIALKLIKPEIASDKKTIERFRNELKTTRMISHRNVCRMFDIGDVEGTHFITMEFIPGEDLKSLIRRVKKIPEGTATSIAKQVCEGLAEAHRLGVVHRDLKSNNIMIDKEGNARIMDFGIARSLSAKGLTGEGIIIGTPEYMSPEQAEAKEVDQRSDIYSLGVILYEMVTGQLPFEGDSALSIAMKHKGESPTDPQAINAQIPDVLSLLILKCLEKDKEARYQSAEELRSELTNIEKGMPTTERVVTKRKPLTSREITLQFSTKKLLIPALVVVALSIAVVMFVWQPWSQDEAVLLSPDKPSIAIMYFKNNTGSENLNFWSSALSDSIINDISQSKFISVLGTPDLYSILKGLNLLEAKTYASEDLKKVAMEGKVNHVLQGALSKAGDTFRIEYSLYEMNTGAIISSDRVEGTGEESIFSMVDDLTKRIKASLEMSEEQIAGDLDKDVRDITTSYPEAYRLLIEGRTLYFEGDRKEAIEKYKKAIAIDPEFAYAYFLLGNSYRNMGYREEEKRCMQKALELSARVSTIERYRIQVNFYRTSEETIDKAIEASNKLLLIYPDDWRIKENLGFIYLGLGLWDKAGKIYRSLIDQNVELYFVYVNLSTSYMRRGLYNEAQDVLEYYLNNISEHAGIHNYLRRNYFSQGKYNLALNEFDKGFSVNPNYFITRSYRYLKGDIYLLMGNLPEAKKEYEKYDEGDEPIALAWGKRRQAALLITQGKFEKAKEQVQQGIELAIKVNEKSVESSLRRYLGYFNLKSGDYKGALEEINKAGNNYIELGSLSGQILVGCSRGLIYLQMKKLNEAQKEADELTMLIDRGLNERIKRYYYYLVGMIEFNREDYSKAIEYFNQALVLEPHGLQKNAKMIEPLARAYFLEGEFEKAEEEYVRITNLTSGRLYYGDIYAKSFYMLGKIHEQQGDTTKAIEHYEKFLDLWKDADPGMAEVEDAKKRLAGLKKH